MEFLNNYVSTFQFSVRKKNKYLALAIDGIALIGS